MPNVSAEELEDLIRRILVATGAPDRSARIVADSLVLSNLKGVDSHGLVRVAQYVEQIGSGRIVPAAEPAVEERGAIVHVDGRWGFGQVAAREAARSGIEQAEATGLAAATLTRVQHVGRLGEYVELAAHAGHIGLAFCNSGPASGWVAPFGGRRRILPTNPLAYAIPTGPGAPIVADFSTSAAAEGRLRLARQNGQDVPEGWIIDAQGMPTRNPSDFYAGGALLPAGGHKGYALAVLVEVLGGVLAGAGCASTGAAPGNGLVLLVLDPRRFRPDGAFPAEVDGVAGALRAVEPAEGFERVKLPGEPEAETEERRRREGIPVPEATWQELLEVAASVGVSAP